MLFVRVVLANVKSRQDTWPCPFISTTVRCRASFLVLLAMLPTLQRQYTLNAIMQEPSSHSSMAVIDPAFPVLLLFGSLSMGVLALTFTFRSSFHFLFLSITSHPSTSNQLTACLTASCGTTPCEIKISTNPCNGSMSFFGNRS